MLRPDHINKRKVFSKFLDKKSICNISQSYEERSRHTLERALRDISFYSAWHVFDPGSRAIIDDRFTALPVLTKADIRDHFPHGLVPRNIDLKEAFCRGEIEPIETSGTTSERVVNLWNQRWWDASERASWQIHPIMRRWATGSHREAILTGSKNVGYISDKCDLSFRQRRLDRFLYLNEKTTPLLWRIRHYLRMLAELDRYQPDVLEANPSYLWRLCRFALARHIKIWQPRAVIFTYERPMAYQLHYIRQVLHCPLISSYGTTELGYVFMQCDKGHFHQNIDFCRVDFQPLSQDHDGPYRGRILVTTFKNQYYQIMRFDPGDIVYIADKACSCGRSQGVVLKDIEGRFVEATVDTNGRIVTVSQLDKTVYDSVGPYMYELSQTSYDRYYIRFEEPVNNQRILAGLRRLYGRKARVIVELIKHISPSASSKFRHASTSFDLNIQDFL